MADVRLAIRVLPGGVSSPARRQPPLAAGYEHFRLERQGALLSAKTLDYYDGMVLPFLKWVDAEGVQRFDHLDVSHVRLYRAQLAVRPGLWGRTLAAKTLLESHRAILCFLRWARRESFAAGHAGNGAMCPRGRGNAVRPVRRSPPANLRHPSSDLPSA
jgi:site-specific recombinase XerC